mgnify:CR=1 FL=1
MPLGAEGMRRLGCPGFLVNQSNNKRGWRLRWSRSTPPDRAFCRLPRRASRGDRGVARATLQGAESAVQRRQAEKGEDRGWSSEKVRTVDA